jgi:hypothetical protein
LASLKAYGRFSDTSSNLLVWSAVLSPRDSFHGFKLESLINLAKLYPQNFYPGEMRDLDKALRLYIADVRLNISFSNIEITFSPSFLRKWWRQGGILCILCFIGC